MQLILTRFKTDGDATLGRLEIPGPVYKIYAVLEPAPPVTPVGVYPLVYEHSNKFRRQLWELKNVPGHSEIKIHNGNCRYGLDARNKRIETTEGCLLIGMKHGSLKLGWLDSQPAVLSSRLALEDFHRNLAPYVGTNVSIEIIDGEDVE